jgi:hypothetical protein
MGLRGYRFGRSSLVLIGIELDKRSGAPVAAAPPPTIGQCLAEAFFSHLDEIRDPRVSVEVAFDACTSEELALIAGSPAAILELGHHVADADGGDLAAPGLPPF